MEWIKGKKKSFSIINYVNNKFSIKKTKKWRNKTLYRKKKKKKWCLKLTAEGYYWSLKNLIIETRIDDGVDRSKSDFASDWGEEDEETNGNKGNEILSNVDGRAGTREDEAEEDYFTGDNKECENEGLETQRITHFVL